MRSASPPACPPTRWPNTAPSPTGARCCTWLKPAPAAAPRPRSPTACPLEPRASAVSGGGRVGRPGGGSLGGGGRGVFCWRCPRSLLRRGAGHQVLTAGATLGLLRLGVLGGAA